MMKITDAKDSSHRVRSPASPGYSPPAGVSNVKTDTTLDPSQEVEKY